MPRSCSREASVMLMRAHGHARNLPEAWRLWRRLPRGENRTELPSHIEWSCASPPARSIACSFSH